MNSLENKNIVSINELSLLIDRQVEGILLKNSDWLISFIDGDQVIVNSNISLTAIIIASFANNNLRGIPSGFEILLDYIKNKNVTSLLIIRQDERNIKVIVRLGYLEEELFLSRDPEIFRLPYSLNEYFEEIGPNIQKFVTGRSLAPLPRQYFIERIKNIVDLIDNDGLDSIIILPPLMITVGITDLCNFKCEMCFRTRKDYMPGRYVFPDDILQSLILDMANMGIRGLRFCGEGENMLHPKFLETIMLAKVVGLRTFIITNGTLLKHGYRIVARCLDYLRVSFNALAPESYCKVHGINSEQTYFLVLDGLRAVINERNNLSIESPIISMSCVIIKSSIDEALTGKLGEDLKSMGLDLLVLKSDRLWEMREADKHKYFKIISTLNNLGLRVTDYSDYSSSDTVIIDDWEQKLGLGCSVRFLRANIDRFAVHSWVTQQEVYGIITEKRLPEIWRFEQRIELQRRRSQMKFDTCSRCFWGDFHRIMNYLFEKELLKK